MLRRLLLFIVGCAVGLITVPAIASTEARVDVVVVRGNLDARAIDFVVGAVLKSNAHVVVLQMDPGVVLSDGIERLLEVVADPPVPLAVWLGPAPASALGGAALVVSAAPVSGAAPGTVIGPALPVVAGGGAPALLEEFAPLLPSEVRDGRVLVGDSPIVDLVDLIAPSIGQFVVGLHGLEVVVAGETVTLATARTEVIDGVPAILPLHQVRFIEPGLVDRILAVGTQPATVFAFLVFGLALIVFEFYAAGPGIVAAIAAIVLLLAGHGIATLPVWWPAVGAAVLAVVLYVVEFQRNDLGWKSVLGTLLLGFAGFRLVGGDESLTPGWWTVMLIVLGTAAFFAVALTTVARTRFATQTIGRDHLIGRTGMAVGALDPEGLVNLDGARWKARATRAAGIGDGDSVTVVAVRGVVLLVDPA